MLKIKKFLQLMLILSLACFSSTASLAAGTLEKISVYGKSLDGNLEGDDPSREVFVYLPPSYAENSNKRYPVVYFLHGYNATAQMYIDFLGLPSLADEAIAAGADEMIIVMANAYTRYGGSFYSNSPTIGDWESYIAKDLVGYIDSHYRSLAKRESRGLSGHSMGGYGTLRIGMKRPEVFSSLFVMSAGAILDQLSSPTEVAEQAANMAEDIETGEVRNNSRQALYAAWTSNPQNPPFYFDLPYQDSELQPLVQARWLANAPLAMLGQYVPALKSYQAIFMDVGDEDSLAASNIELDAAFTQFGIEHGFEVYSGGHGNRVVQRFKENLLPFFSENLSSGN